MTDPYQILGVARDAPADEIRKAYRGLAKKSHPDLHPGDKKAEARFKEIASAYAIVGDETKRALFDSGKIDASGAELRPLPERESYRQHAETHPGFKYERGWSGSGLDDDVFAEIFRSRDRAHARGADLNYTFSVEFLEAVVGARKRVVMADGKTIDIAIPPGLKDGQTLRLRGQGQPGTGGAEPGDVLVEVHVKPHPVFRREGYNIQSTVPVTLGQALGGAKIDVETVSGTVSVAVPKGAQTGTRLRLRGKGVPTKSGTGDHVIELRVILPADADDEFVKTVIEWEAEHPYDPKKQMGAPS